MKGTVDNQPFSFFQRIQIALISAFGAVLVRLLGLTIRFESEGEEVLIEHLQEGRAAIPAFWHNQILSAAYYFRFRNILVITSRHFDGECISRIIERLGFGSVRGSSSRGGVRALIEIKRFLDQGRVVAFTVDGPLGPVYQAKSGPVWLSANTGAPILCFHVEPQRFWTLRTWDRFRIPKPFSRAYVKFGRPLVISPEAGVEVATRILQGEMDRVKADCVARYRQSIKSG